MTPAQLAYKRTAQPAGSAEYVGDIPRYYVWQERPRIPDHEGGEQPIDWTRQERGGHL
jgi:hypothetical protein